MSLLSFAISEAGWFILKILTKLGNKWAKNKYRNKIIEKIEPLKDGKLTFAKNIFSNNLFRSAIKNNSDVDLFTKELTANVICNGITINKINWSQKEKPLDDKKKLEQLQLTQLTMKFQIYLQIKQGNLSNYIPLSN